MPIYEYICEEDGHTVSLLRAMADADTPVDDPEGRGRRFVRKHSTFATRAAPGQAPRGVGGGGGCACGNPHGPCGR